LNGIKTENGTKITLKEAALLFETEDKYTTEDVERLFVFPSGNDRRLKTTKQR